MKKIVCIFLMLLLCCSLFAQANKNRVFRFGAGIGFSGLSKGQSSVELNFTARPFSFSVMNPFARVEAGLSFDKEYSGFSPFKLTVGAELFRSMKNPLFFTVNNMALYSPSVSATYTLKGTFVFEVSAFRVLEKDFTYEWFAPFFVFNSDGFDSWGVYFLRMTSMF